MDIELRLLRSFVAIYENGSVSRAAERMHCTQAAMSMRLKLLETDMKGSLFLRQHHRLEPTALGTDLYARALTVLAAYDEMLSATRRPTRARVRIGMPDDYALAFLGPVLNALGPAAHDIDIEVVCDLSATLLAQVQRRETDLALVTLTVPPADAQLTVRAPLRWLAGVARPEGTVRLAAYPEGCVFRRAMIDALSAAGSTWQVAMQSRGQAGIIASLRAGAAVTAVAAGTGPEGLVEIEADETLPRLPDVSLSLLSAPGAGTAAVARVERALAAVLSARYAVEAA